MQEKFTVTRMITDERGRFSTAASYTYGSETKARARFESMAAAIPGCRLKLTVTGAGQEPAVIARQNL